MRTRVLQSSMGSWRISEGDEQGSLAGILLLPYFEEFTAGPGSSPTDIRQDPIGDCTGQNQVCVTIGTANLDNRIHDGTESGKLSARWDPTFDSSFGRLS